MVERRKRTIKDYAKQVEESSKKPPQKLLEGRFDQVVSTGSTRLDLAISGGRIRGGGIPGGVYVEIFGPESWGKTALLAEIAASVIKSGGDIHYDDTEGRFDLDYAEKLGIEIPKDKYSITEKVEDLKVNFEKWMPKKSDKINGYFVDSIAAMTSEWEKLDKDERGQRKAKMLHKFFRLNKSKIGERNWIFVFTNQIISGGGEGETTPGGKAAKFWSSVRIRLGPHPAGKYLKSSFTSSTDYKEERIFGVRIQALIKKSSVDDAYRQAPISIVYGYGIDDIRENLMYVKEVTGNDSFDFLKMDERGWKRLDTAIQWVEEQKLQSKLREKVIDIWCELEKEFRERRPRTMKERI